MIRKILIILVVLILLAGGAYAIFLFGGKKTPPQVVAPVAQNETPVVLMEPLPAEEPESPLTVVTSEEVFDYWINRLDGQIYYITSDGTIKRADKNGNPSTISSSHFSGGVGGVFASSRGDAVLISSANPIAPEFKIFDVERAAWRALPVGTTAASWSPSSPTNEVAFLKTVAKKEGGTPVSSLNIYTLSKGTSRQVFEMPYYDLSIDWITPSIISFSQKPTREAVGSIWQYNLQKKTLRPLLIERTGLWSSWQAASSIHYDVTNGLYLLSAQGTETRLPFFSLPTKCTQEALQLYCAVPKGDFDEGSLPDSYIQRAVMTSDVFTATSLSELPRFSSSKVLLEKNGPAIDAWHLVKAGPRLYFINRYDQKVYALRVLTD